MLQLACQRWWGRVWNKALPFPPIVRCPSLIAIWFSDMWARLVETWTAYLKSLNFKLIILINHCCMPLRFCGCLPCIITMTTDHWYWNKECLTEFFRSGSMYKIFQICLMHERINLKNIQATPPAQLQKNKWSNQKMGQRTKQTLLQGRHTNG